MSRETQVQDVVIGSGAGGAVLAARLAESGRSVLVIEEGPSVDRHSFTQREDEMYGRLYRMGGGQMTADGTISVLQGRCLGGSTTVNMGDCVSTPPEVLEHWRQQHGWGDWGGITNEDVEAAARRAMAEMGATVIADADLNRSNTLLRDGAAQVGLRARALVHNRVGCTGSGYCLLGCAYDAKRGTLLSHLPRARAAGADIWCDAWVEILERQSGGGWAVRGPQLTAFAERVFVCAGAIHSPALLRRSRIGGGAVGEHLSLQPQVPAMAVFNEVVDWHRGVPQSIGIDGALGQTAEAGLHGYTIEGLGAGPAMAAATLPLPIGELRALLARYRHMAGALCLVPDRPGGSIEWSRRGRQRIQYDLQPAWWDAARLALKDVARCWLAMGATEVRFATTRLGPIRSETDLSALDGLNPRPAEWSLISAHPQGTCRMGSGADSVVGLDFRVRGHDDLYLCDASLFPTTASTHTMVPVMAMAHLLADALT